MKLGIGHVGEDGGGLFAFNALYTVRNMSRDKLKCFYKAIMLILEAYDHTTEKGIIMPSLCLVRINQGCLFCFASSSLL